jgi:hypothetical protein
MTSLLNFIKIYQLVQKLLGGTHRQTDIQAGDLISLTFLFKESRLKTVLINGILNPGPTSYKVVVLSTRLLGSAILSAGNTHDADIKLVATERKCEENSYAI